MFRGIQYFNPYYLLIRAKINSNIFCKSYRGNFCWHLFEGDISGINLWVVFYLHFTPPIKYTYTVTTTNISYSSATIGITCLTGTL